MIAFFVTGTDTNAGKTHVSKALLLAGRARGMTAAGYKPIETGCPADDMPGPDAIALATAGDHPPITTYRFSPPISPHLAARQSGVAIEKAALVARVHDLLANREMLLIEGAGGLLVPISQSETMADLASALDLPLIIVAANRLGAINHSLLAVEAARQRGIRIAALVLSEISIGAGKGLQNAEAIGAHAELQVHEFPHTRSRQELVTAGSVLLERLLGRGLSSSQRI